MIRSARQGMPDDAENLHATAVVLEEAAILVTGESGSGKTHLALSLLGAWQAQGRFARLLADDQVFVMNRRGRLLARVPAATAGLAEVSGRVVAMPHVPQAEICLVVDLGGGAVPPGAAPTVTLKGVELPVLRLGRRPDESAFIAISAALAAICNRLSARKRVDCACFG